jgi:uncharacterized protein (TIGR03435 family)
MVMRYSSLAAMLLAGMVLLGSSAPAQSGAASEFKFEVLSLRPIQPGAALSLTTAPTPNGYVGRMSVWQMIMLAHVSVNYTEWAATEMLNPPKWVGEFYDIDARVSQADLKAWQSQSQQRELLRAAMRAALKERCKLELHRQPSEAPNWELVVGKNGPRLKTAAPDFAAPPRTMTFPGGGVMVQTVAAGKQVKDFRGATMADLIWFLNVLSTGVPVRDKTNLTGRYDFTLREVDPLTDDRSALSKYPLDELGLRLRAGKENRPMLVIDHIEKPSAN